MKNFITILFILGFTLISSQTRNYSSEKTTAIQKTAAALDSDGDGYADYSADSDDDNDGILDCIENQLNNPINQIFNIQGNATTINSSEVRLTDAITSQNGQMWTVGKMDFSKSFVIYFDAYLGNNDGGADGIAIVFHNSPLGTSAVGISGGGLGASGIANGIVLELDTFNNSNYGDISADHGQIWDSDNQSGAGLLTTATALSNLENGAWHAVVVAWNASAQAITYTVDGVLAGSFNGNLITNYFGGASKVYFGFTASTGGYVNDQRIRFSNFCTNLPAELDTDNDGISNHLDLDSDGDGCADAIEGDENVIPAQLASNRISGSVDSSGVPNLVNVGGTADFGSDQAQGMGEAFNSSVTTQCTDTDGDGYPDNIDLDDDNDGILDLVECNVACSDIFVNGGYETPNITQSPYNSSTFKFVPQAESGGWQTTAIDGQIEFWRSGFNGVSAAEGNQFVELNANYASTLYQTFCLNGSAGTVTWSLKHRGRYGTDVATVKMGNSLANATVIATMTDGTSGWGSYSGTYNIPAGQNTLIIAFESVSASGGPTQGNFLDDILINITQGCADNDVDGIPNSLDTDSDGDGCSDAAEGDENVLYTQVSSGRITGPVDSNGVPVLVNSGGAADIGSDQGQGAGDTANSGNVACKCNLASSTDGNAVTTKHGITALGRAGSENGNWPMARNGGWTALEAKTKGFVINRLTSAEIAAISSSQLKQGMMVYNTTLDCLYVNTNGTATGWKCFNAQGCPFNF